MLSSWTWDHAHEIKFRRPEVRLVFFLESSYRMLSKASGCSAVLEWPFQSLTMVMFLQLTNSREIWTNLANGMKIEVYFFLVWSCAGKYEKPHLLIINCVARCSTNGKPGQQSLVFSQLPNRMVESSNCFLENWPMLLPWGFKTSAVLGHFLSDKGTASQVNLCKY